MNFINDLQRGWIPERILGTGPEDDETLGIRTKNHRRFIPTLRPHATLRLLPLPDGSRTFRAKREGMPLAGRTNVGAA